MAYVLDTWTASYAGVPVCTNVPGLIGARLHFLSSGDRYDLAHHHALSEVRDRLPPLPRSHVLVHNFPNPISGATTLAYYLPAAGPTRLEVFDVAGRQVEELWHGFQESGWHTIEWSAQVPSGVYLYRLTSQAGCATGKCVVR
jgi:hypothetical protein